MKVRQHVGIWLLCNWVLPRWLGRLAFWLARD